MHSPLAATALLEPITRPPIPPKAAARFAVRAFCALLRLPTRTVRKPQAVATFATIQAPRPGGKARGLPPPIAWHSPRVPLRRQAPRRGGQRGGVGGAVAAPWGDGGAPGAGGRRLLLFPAGGALGAVNARHDDWRSITVRGRRRRCTLGALYMSLYVFLGARRRGRRRPKDSNGQGEGHHSG